MSTAFKFHKRLFYFVPYKLRGMNCTGDSYTCLHERKVNSTQMFTLKPYHYTPRNYSLYQAMLFRGDINILGLISCNELMITMCGASPVFNRVLYCNISMYDLSSLSHTLSPGIVKGAVPSTCPGPHEGAS